MHVCVCAFVLPSLGLCPRRKRVGPQKLGLIGAVVPGVSQVRWNPHQHVHCSLWHWDQTLSPEGRFYSHEANTLLN